MRPATKGRQGHCPDSKSQISFSDPLGSHMQASTGRDGEGQWNTQHITRKFLTSLCHTFAYKHAHMHTRTHACKYVHAHTHTHTHTHTRARAHTHRNIHSLISQMKMPCRRSSLFPLLVVHRGTGLHTPHTQRHWLQHHSRRLHQVGAMKQVTMTSHRTTNIV